MSVVELVTEDKIPESNERVILEYVGSEECERSRYMRTAARNNIAWTDSVCNYKFHGCRTLFSMWKQDLPNFCKDAVKALDFEPLDGSTSPNTPLKGSHPLRVLKYMKDGYKHYSTNELLTHESMTLALKPFVGYYDDIMDVLFTEQKLYPDSSSYVITTHAGDVNVYVTATLRLWRAYLLSSKVDKEHPAYKEIHDLFYKFYPQTTIPINVGEVESNTWKPF